MQSRWVTTGKACGLIVENSPQRLWKVPVSAAYNGVSKCPCRLWIEGGYFTAPTWPKTKGTGRLARPVPNAPETNGYFSEVLMVSKFELSWLPTTVHGGDDRNRDSGCNQAILDGRSS